MSSMFKRVNTRDNTTSIICINTNYTLLAEIYIYIYVMSSSSTTMTSKDHPQQLWMVEVIET